MIAQGPVVAELEAAFAEMCGVKHVVAVNNGTTALIAALESLDLQPGDEVVTSPFTFVATINAILKVGATARFADINTSDFNVSAATMVERVTKRTKALMPVHLYGQVADMESIAPLATQHGLELVEDAAQSHLASQNGRMAGTWGVGCFSLYATKNLTSGEGGLISTNDDLVADRLRVLRNQGMRQRYQYEMAGNNYRLTDLQAAVCLPQLSRYADAVESRRTNAALLTEALSGIDWLQTPTQLENRGHVWHQYTLLVSRDAPATRDEVSERLSQAGVGSGFYYPRVAFDYDCYRNHPQIVADDVPVAFDVAARCISIPVHPGVTESDVECMADVFRSFK